MATALRDITHVLLPEGDLCAHPWGGSDTKAVCELAWYPYHTYGDGDAAELAALQQAVADEEKARADDAAAKIAAKKAAAKKANADARARARAMAATVKDEAKETTAAENSSATATEEENMMAEAAEVMMAWAASVTSKGADDVSTALAAVGLPARSAKRKAIENMLRAAASKGRVGMRVVKRV